MKPNKIKVRTGTYKKFYTQCTKCGNDMSDETEYLLNEERKEIREKIEKMRAELYSDRPNYIPTHYEKIRNKTIDDILKEI